MKQKAYVRPTKPTLIAGMIGVSALFLFGIVFFILLAKEDSGIGMIFMVFWLVVVLAIGGYFAYSLVNYDKNETAGAGGEILFRDIADNGKTETTFDDKLRKLETLRKEGLISEEEYLNKRKEIMDQKW